VHCGDIGGMELTSEKDNVTLSIQLEYKVFVAGIRFPLMPSIIISSTEDSPNIVASNETDLYVIF